MIAAASHAVPSLTNEETVLLQSARISAIHRPDLREQLRVLIERGVTSAVARSCHGRRFEYRLNPFRTAPNLLTLLRICLAPFLVAAILEDHYALSFGLFVAAGLTDALDGTAGPPAEAAHHAGPVS